MTPNLYAIASDDSAVVAQLTPVGGSDISFYRDEAPTKKAAPYVRWFVVFGEPMNKLDEAPDMDASRVQFDIFAATQDQADAIYSALRDCFEPHGYIVGYSTGRDLDTRNYFVTFEMTFKTSR